jgi:hypothetical protein
VEIEGKPFFLFVVDRVYSLFFFTVGEHKSDVEDWSKIKVLVGKTGKLGLRRRINAHKMENLIKKNADDAMNELLCIEDVDGIAKKSKGAAIFYAWNKGMLDEWKEEQAADAEHNNRVRQMGGAVKSKGIEL